MKRTAIAKIIDYAVLAPPATDDDVVAAAALCRRWRIGNLTVKPSQVTLASEQLAGSATIVGTVIGFPHGHSLPAIKRAEAVLAIEQGARELDMVCNITAVKSGAWSAVLEDIAAVAQAASTHGVPLKVILETAYLTREEKVTVCRLSEQAGAAFVKTSTGFAPGGATVEDVQLLRSAVGPPVGVKAAGGIRTLADVQKMVAAGASRIGTSSPLAILEGLAG